MYQYIKRMLMGRPKVVVRFAPSPTGFLHIGRARTALFNFLYARKHNGKFLFRIEDTDKARSKKEYEKDIVECLAWLGLEYDNRDYPRQSERTDIYKKFLEAIISENKAYISKEVIDTDAEGEVRETSRPVDTAQGKREEVIRFRNPNKKITFNDLVRGDVEFDTTELGDFIIARSIDEPLYHFTVVVDDYIMQVTHVMRGDDGISNTPRQILIQEAIGAPRPIYAHIPLILAADKSKLSGRHGAVSVRDYKQKGYLPDAVVNYLALLGWNPGTEEEIFTLRELSEKFDLDRVHKGGAVFDEKKLRWINKEHLKRMPKDEFAVLLKKRIETSARGRGLDWNISLDVAAKLVPVILDRIEILSDIDTMVLARDLDFYFTPPEYDSLSLKWKDDKNLLPAAKHLDHVKRTLEMISERNWTEDMIKTSVWPYAEAEGRGNVLWPFRFALSGKDKSPNPFTLSAILGKETTLKRVQGAIKKCSLENQKLVHDDNPEPEED